MSDVNITVTTTGTTIAVPDTVAAHVAADDPHSGTYVSLLARTKYRPGSGSALTRTGATTFGDADAANLAVTFTPTTSEVMVVLSGVGKISNATDAHRWNLRDSGGDVADTHTYVGHNTNLQRVTVPIVVTGLTAGNSYTYKWGIATTNASSTVTLQVGAFYGDALMEVWGV